MIWNKTMQDENSNSLRNLRPTVPEGFFLSIARFLNLLYVNKIPIRRFPLLLTNICQNNSNARVESFTPLEFTTKTTESK